MLRLVCSFALLREKKKTSSPFYLGPNEQFTWLVKGVVKPAKAAGKQRAGLRWSSFPTGGNYCLLLRSETLPLIPPALEKKKEEAWLRSEEQERRFAKPWRTRMASIHNSKRETI